MLNSTLQFITNWQKSNVEVDVFSRIPWHQSISAEAVKAIFKVAFEGPDALMEIYTYHEKAISSLILESPPVQTTVADWVQAQKVDPTINQVVTWRENKRLETEKVG